MSYYYCVLLWALLCQCTTVSPPKPVASNTLEVEQKVWVDTLVLEEAINCTQLATVSIVALDYDTVVITLEFIDSSRAARVVQIDGIRSDMTRVDYCTSDYVVLSSACGGACWMQTVLFFEEQYPVKSYYYAEAVTGAPDLIVHRAAGQDYFEKKTVQNLRTGERASIERFDCIGFQDMNLVMDEIYVEEDSIVFVCDRDYGGAKTKRLALSALK